MTTSSPTPEPAVELLCRSSYYTDTGRHQGRFDREVRCGLPYGHDSDHVEMIDGEPGPSWPQAPAGSTGRPPRASAGASLVSGEYDEAAAHHDALLRQVEQARAENARLRSQLAEAREQRDHAQRWNDEARRAWAVDSAELAVVRGELAEARQQRDQAAEALVRAETERDEARQAHTNATWLIDGQQQEIKYLRNRKDNPGCAKAHEDLATVEAERDSLREERDRLVAEVEKIADEYETEHKQACRRAEDMGLSDAARQRLLGSARVWADVAGRLRALGSTPDTGSTDG